LKRSSAQARYSPHLHRNLQTRLINRFRDKYRFLGGEEITRFIVEDILSLVEEDYRPREMMKKGQILWDGVKIKQKRKPGRSLTMKETETIPIVLTMVSEEDIKKYEGGTSIREIRKDIYERISKEANERGTVLNLSDIGLLTCQASTVVGRYVKEREKEKNIQILTRGRAHDLGSGVTHKAEILRMGKIHKYTVLEIKRRTNHSVDAIERYNRDFDRIEMLLPKLSVQEIVYVTGLSESLVKEYIRLIRELDSERKESGG